MLASCDWRCAINSSMVLAFLGLAGCCAAFVARLAASAALSLLALAAVLVLRVPDADAALAGAGFLGGAASGGGSPAPKVAGECGSTSCSLAARLLPAATVAGAATAVLPELAVGAGAGAVAVAGAMVAAGTGVADAGAAGTGGTVAAGAGGGTGGAGASGGVSGAVAEPSALPCSTTDVEGDKARGGASSSSGRPITAAITSKTAPISRWRARRRSAVLLGGTAGSAAGGKAAPSLSLVPEERSLENAMPLKPVQ